ncbi:MAG TPA: hypothetical protein VMR86_17270 [Myxococcota bacterium]|nr:hypothetical protein [Myxococcota bacterium]
MRHTKILGIALALCMAQALPARAAQVSFQLFGKVTKVTGTALSGLAALGVKKNAPVTIEWTEELTTPVHDTNPAIHSTSYWATTPDNGITAFTIQIGSWTATAANAPDPNAITVNVISVVDGFEGGSQDTLDLSHTSTDTGDLISDGGSLGSEIVVNLLAKLGGGSTSQALGDQTPSQYPDSSGFVSGSGGEVDFTIPGPDPTVKCRAAQIASAGTLCKSALGCLASHAKAPDKDPMSVKVEACLDKARQKFITAFDKETSSALSHGLSCGTAEDGATFEAHFEVAALATKNLIDSVQPQDPPVIAPLFSGAGTMCSTGAKAESKNVQKPSSKVVLLRENARIKLGNAASQLVAKAESKGVTFDPAPDVPGIVSSVDALIDDIVAEVDGD